MSEMTMKQFVTTVYPIEDIIKKKMADPLKAIMESDDLPFDDVVYLDGQLSKVVYLSDDEYIGVLDLLSYTIEDINKMQACELKEVWLAYMDQVDVDEVNIANIMTSARELRNSSMRKAELLSKITE